MVFFFLSVKLSDWAARPVEDAWNRQRQFVADASHELKTPLTVILANTRIITDSGEITDCRNLSRLENISAEASRMKYLIENLLSLARSDAGIRTAASSPVNLSFLAKQCVATFEPIFFEEGKEITCQIEENIQIRGDEKRLRQLIGILLDNACKYSRDASAIDVSLKAAGKEALLTITSEGKPLSPKEQTRIFDRFYRLSPSRGDVPGYGLGLSIAQTIAQEHRGKISVSSDSVKTNHFAVRLPLI